MNNDSSNKIFLVGFLSGLGAAAILGCICFVLWAVAPMSIFSANTSPLLDSSGQSSTGASEIPPLPSSSKANEILSAMPEESSSKVETEAPKESFPGEFALLRNSELLNTLDDEHLELLYNYFDGYYQSLATMRAKDLTNLFEPRTDAEYESTMLNQSTLQILCSIRAERENDLSLDNYEYGLAFTAIEPQPDGSVIIDLLEDSCLKFAFLDGIKSYTSGIKHQFVLVKKANQWLIASHDCSEDLFLRVKDQYCALRGNKPLTNRENVDKLFLGIYDTALEDTITDERYRIEQLEQHRKNSKRVAANEYDYKFKYNRNAAVEYSYMWVDPIRAIRNEEWPVYDGNCNNYISQCIFAGGIPMDCSGTSQWKWCGDAINSSQNMIGRSPSWAEVQDFYDYCKYNERGGPVTQVDADLFYAKPGDILQLGVFGNWYHSVIITEAVEGDDGMTIDFLVNSNASDHLDYPACAYPYSSMRLIRILGYN